jgi:hypothetical protein
MKRSWTKRRTVQELADGEQRWDRAFQLLLRWAQEIEFDRAAHVVAPGERRQEVRDEDSDLCAGVDSAPSSDSVH